LWRLTLVFVVPVMAACGREPALDTCDEPEVWDERWRDACPTLEAIADGCDTDCVEWLCLESSSVIREDCGMSGAPVLLVSRAQVEAVFSEYCQPETPLLQAIMGECTYLGDRDEPLFRTVNYINCFEDAPDYPFCP